MGRGATGVTLLAVLSFPDVFLIGASDGITAVPDVLKTFLALAAVGFMKLDPLLDLLAAAADRVLGRE